MTTWKPPPRERVVPINPATILTTQSNMKDTTNNISTTITIDGVRPKTTKIKKRKERKPRSSFIIPEWDSLPDILLEEIFSRLNIRDRNSASQVCRNWNRIFYSSRVWKKFVLDDYTLTRRRYNYYMGYQYVLDHYRTQICLQRVGRAMRELVINPMENFFNLYEFMTITTYFCEFFEDEPMTLLHSLDFTFGCERADTENDVFGTGGKLLQALKRLMSNLTGLRHLSLQDLLLDKAEAMYLLDDVAYNCCETMKSLRLVNCTKDPYPIFPAGVFINLNTLTISPQHINDDVVELLSYTNLRHLYLLQTKHTDKVLPVSSKAWRECRKIAPFLNVHLKMEGKLRTELVWQEGAAVKSVIYDCPYSTVSYAPVLTCTTLYRNDLQTYAHLGLPRFHMPRSFQDRADSSLMLIVRSCPYLHTIVIRELISTATVLLLAKECKTIKRLVVRQNALLKKFDWSYNPEWTIEFYQWLKTSSQSQELMSIEVSRLLGKRWKPLTDREFKKLRL